jgi:hypothetical protein
VVGKGGGTNTVPALRVNFPLFVRCDGEGDINESCFLTGRVGLDANIRSCIGVRVETEAPCVFNHVNQ